jgi:hypothetical protein
MVLSTIVHALAIVLRGYMAGQLAMFLLSNYFKHTGCINTSNSVLQHTLAKSNSSKIFGHVPLVPHMIPDKSADLGKLCICL